MSRTYRTATDFKQSLEQRLRTASSSGFDLARRRQLVVFDRFLARIALELGDAVTLKGGLAVELRLERARSTTDVDLRVMGPPDAILLRLDDAARRDLGETSATSWSSPSGPIQGIRRSRTPDCPTMASDTESSAPSREKCTPARSE